MKLMFSVEKSTMSLQWLSVVVNMEDKHLGKIVFTLFIVLKYEPADMD